MAHILYGLLIRRGDGVVSAFMFLGSEMTHWLPCATQSKINASQLLWILWSTMYRVLCCAMKVLY